jgi:hypothetical protein
MEISNWLLAGKKMSQMADRESRAIRVVDHGFY